MTWTVRETAERLGITLSTAYAYVESGELPSVRLGRRLLIPRAAGLLLARTWPEIRAGGPAVDRLRLGAELAMAWSAGAQ